MDLVALLLEVGAHHLGELPRLRHVGLVEHDHPDPLGEGDAPGMHPDDGEVLGPPVALHDFVGDSGQGAAHLVAAEDDRLGDAHEFPGTKK